MTILLFLSKTFLNLKENRHTEINGRAIPKNSRYCPCNENKFVAGYFPDSLCLYRLEPFKVISGSLMGCHL